MTKRGLYPFWQALNVPQRWGCFLLSALVVFSVSIPLLTHLSVHQQNLLNVLALPSWSDPLGTDHLGRSMLARIAAAIRLSLGLSIVSVFTSASIGISLGVIAGWRGGAIDRVLAGIAEMVGAMPGLLLILLVAAMMGGSYFGLYIAIAAVLWLEYFRTIRTIVKSVATSAELQSSRLLGFSYWYCFRYHLWPRMRSAVVTLAIFGCANTILMLATLGFVSVGLKPPTAELGLMMTELFIVFYEAPWVLMQPVVTLMLLVLSLHLLAPEQR